MRRRIISEIQGGLGNQLFQYAAGRALALRGGCELLLDRRYFDHGPMAFGLHHFNIGRAVDLGKIPPRPRDKKGLKYTLMRRLGILPRLLREEGLGFDSRLMAPLSNVYVYGYRQSERYFADAERTVREDLRMITPPTAENARHLADIAACPAVSLHVRRGDYLLPVNQALFAAPALAYYSKALQLVASKMAQEPVVYVFSDEPQWARENLPMPFEKRVMEHNGPDKNYEDLRLMSACRHHIIANSSFSWWGAWLNPSPDKVVVAPERWFADPAVQNPDIIPDGWFKLAG